MVWTETDVNTFALAFAVVWGGLAAYLAWMHWQQRKLAEEIERLEKSENQ